MRWFPALLTSVLASAAVAAPALAADEGPESLFDAAFASALDIEGASIASSFGASTARYQAGEGLVRRTSGPVLRFGRTDATYVDTVMLSTVALDPLPGAALLRAGAGDVARPQGFDLTFVRNWPAAISISAGRLTLDITPHAGVGVSTGGAQTAEAGALVRLGAQVQDRVLQAMGMRGAGRHSRWYLYAGGSGRAVGLNLLRGDEAARRDDLAGDGFVRQAQAGVGMSRGALHALIGYTQERVTMRAFGEQVRNDGRVGLTLSLR
jgi:hypothetical protein